MNEHSKKAKLRQAQQRHQSQLFGGDAQKPSAQAADSHAQRRGNDLSQAAQAKQQRLSVEETRKLEELKHRNARARAQQAPPAAPAPTVPEPRRVEPPAPTEQSATSAEPTDPKRPSAQPHPLEHAAGRSDMAAAALANMQKHMRQQAQRPAPAEPQPPQPTQPPAQPSPPPAQPTPQAPPPQPARPPAPGQRPSGTRRPPSPEELDKLLRQMADRARQRQGGAAPRPRPAMPGMPDRGMEAAAPVEAAPPPPDAVEREKHTAEQSAEILKELEAKEATAQRDIAPIPQADQERAKEEAVEASVPIRTEANALSSGPLHDAIADLQQAMRIADPTGQVDSANAVQRRMPHHPLYRPEDDKGRT